MVHKTMFGTRPSCMNVAMHHYSLVYTSVSFDLDDCSV
jgi:hypothetical protein